jgi:hypothetical protein
VCAAGRQAAVKLVRQGINGLREGLRARVRAVVNDDRVGDDGSGLCLLVACREDRAAGDGWWSGQRRVCMYRTGTVQGRIDSSIDKTRQRQDGDSDNQC